jgi:hypothetical protein
LFPLQTLRSNHLGKHTQEEREREREKKKWRAKCIIDKLRGLQK